MEVGKLTVKRRNITGKSMARKLRTQGRLPGICYGSGVEQPIMLDFDGRAFRASLDPTKRQNTVIDLTVEDDAGAGQSFPVMVKDYQIDPIRRELTHVDFITVDTSSEVTAEVPLEFTGKSKGVELGGTLHVVRHELEVRCKPADIPSKIVIDISDLDTNDVIHVRDLKLPEGVFASTAEQLTIITCVPAEGGAEAEGEGEGEAAAK
ncbi:50S ribosomal protein L25 [Haliangium ochraceum]|uniref:Large ribosomal subunit protein bL25 n=1 Tax=Haliangium ochraceum (strain DSM 14365 / JCM 11303 / SMP-2) TaxID=502025 RepID=D0LPV8_HALO1|nr:50S ribosomal protein L25 [Haliangium ochraceum]ACY16995.1 ribosomal 5S rRNA E-loop binding protein Ctc/L25/TL5 [Haliangium ochraceum DSM 14365]